MRADANIKRDVEDELRWDPDINATDIGVWNYIRERAESALKEWTT
jgi:hypothetical protein